LSRRREGRAGGEGEDERAVDPCRVEQFQLAAQAAGLKFFVAFVDGFDPRPDEPPGQRQHVQEHGDGVEVQWGCGTDLVGAGAGKEAELGDHDGLAGRQQRR